VTVNHSSLRRTLRIATSAGALAAGLVLMPAPVRAQCVPVGPGSDQFDCSGTSTTTQTVITPNADLTTLPGFSIDTTASGGDALTVTAAGSLSYSDMEESSLTGLVAGLRITATGDFAGDAGGVGVITTGPIGGGQFGIVTANAGTGSTAISAFAEIESGFTGIRATQAAAGLNMSIVVGGGGASVSGDVAGIEALNDGRGETRLTLFGDVTGGDTGVLVRNGAASTGDLIV
jgi:hypothetical protein